MLRNQKGFTLIELIIVIVIIGILAAVAVPKFNSLDASAKVAACNKNVMNIQQATISYYGDVAIGAGGQGAWPGDTAALVTAGLLAADLTCPVANDGTGYTISADGDVTCAATH